MMNYEMFKEKVEKEIKDYFPETMKVTDVITSSTKKINRTLDALIVNFEGVSISPTIYINDMYSMYEAGGSIEEVFRYASECIIDGIDRTPTLDFTNAKDNIVYQVINTLQNKDLLSEIPNRSFNDLSIVYRWIIDKDETGMESTIINNGLAKKLGLSEDELFSLAKINTERLLPPTVMNMNELIREVFIRDGMPEELADMMMNDMSIDQQLYVISNDVGINGATSMLSEETFHKLAEEIGTDLYVMPSSIHEVIAVSSNMGDPNDLAQMVAEVNMAEVAPNERLSNQVYHYDKDARKLSLATDTPNKSIAEKNTQAENIKPKSI